MTAIWTSRETAAAVRDALSAGRADAATRLVTELLSRIILAPEGEAIPAAAVAEPSSTGDERYDVLIGVGLAYALSKRGKPLPSWVAEIPALETEWLWDGNDDASPAFRDYIRERTPPMFREKGILLRERDLIAP